MDFTTVDQLIVFLIDHKNSAYLILFLGSMFETIIGFSFFVYGELFFLAGSIMAGMGILDIRELIVVLYAGGIIGDSISYFLGFRYGPLIYDKLKNIRYINRYINDENYRKGTLFFQRKGAISIFLARLLGPISWITPFVAGIYKLKYRKFLFYNIPGVIIGIGEFIVVGYFFGRHFDKIFKIISNYLYLFVFIVIYLILLYFFLKKTKLPDKIRKNIRDNKRHLARVIANNFLVSSALLLALYAFFLFFIFFVNTPEENRTSIKTKTIMLDLNDCQRLKLYYHPDKNNVEQPINVILTAKAELLSLILGPKWIKNDIFDINEISFPKYISLLKNRISPVSSLYFEGYPQDYAYQTKTRSLAKREHIRIWEFQDGGYKNYYASITYDNGYSLNFYNYFFTPIHKIDKNIDKSRDFFYDFLMSRKDLDVTCRYVQTKCAVAAIGDSNEESDEQKYFTDGMVLSCIIGKTKK
jgi:membrane-associated protein